jgi:hypothetical protein
MTEEEWRSCADVGALTKFLESDPRARPWRLFACACCRQAWDTFSASARKAVEVAERFFEGEAGDQERMAARHVLSLPGAGVGSDAAFYASAPVLRDPTFARKTTLEALTALGGDIYHKRASKVEPTVLCGLLRCIFGNPFRAPNFDPIWLARNDGAAVRLATSIATERAFDRLPILADALEDAGCDDGEALEHCRGPGPHALGCWVVDLLLKKR